ncbi:MAG: NAD-dependent epimerase/dehydratase family protein [Deltaproteobacteria bacterium]|nr:NAD-dependent epimerase/dehydratase family protein [Deltaproteobacteria bacterium]
MTVALVTGGAGFIGSAVARALAAAGHEVRIAGTSFARDPLTVASLGEFDLVVHCAGGSSVAASVADPVGDYEKTVPPFQLVLDRAKAQKARVVLLSSGAVYGLASVLPTPETAAIAPVSPYGVHKRRCEELCEQSGTACVVVRLFSVYGPGLTKQLLWDACGKARAGEPVFGGTGDEQRDWLHIDDAAALIVRAADEASLGVPVINGGRGQGVRVRDVVGQICRELGAPAPRFTGLVREGDPAQYIADITRARELGWQPRVALADGISQVVRWFREHS